jgi:molybdopterin molybdotransferase
MVTFELFVRPTLRKMMGHSVLDRPRILARASGPIANPGSRRGYLRVAVSPAGDHYAAQLTGDQGSGILRSMVLADGLAVLAPEARLEKGDRVEVIVLRPLTPLRL